MTNNNIILTCCGFHRSATSVTAHWIHGSGLTMGNWLMPGAESNPDGHFEDMPMVSLNNHLLELQNTDWCFHDEVALENTQAAEQYQLYINRRDRIHQNQSWAVKDPRLCLFLPEWHSATSGRGRYLILIRHWRECIHSLLKRDKDSPKPNFAANPEITAQMWYSYNLRLLEFARKHPHECFVLDQSELSESYPLPEVLNSKFKTSLNEETPSPFRASQSSNLNPDNSQFHFLPKDKADTLDKLWNEISKLTSNSSPNYPDEKTSPLSDKRFQGHSKMTVTKGQANFQKTVTTLEKEVSQSGILDKDISLDNARKAIQQMEWESAEYILEKLIIYSQASPFFYVMLADCKYHLNKKNEAVILYKKSITLNAKNPTFFLKLGQLYINEGDFTKAKELLAQGIENNPDNSRWLHITMQLTI